MMNSSSPSFDEGQSSLNSQEFEALLEEMVRVCEEASKGNLEPRVLSQTNDPRLAKMAEAINSLLDSTDVFVRESTASLRAASEKRFYRRVLERGMQGTFRAGAKLLNNASASMHEQYDQLAKTDDDRVSMIRDLESTLSESSTKISDAIKQIGSITKGTHILALNAKIEAARAGDAGRGFAIVAHEVELTSQRVNDVMIEIDRVFAEFNEETKNVLSQVANRRAA